MTFDKTHRILFIYKDVGQLILRYIKITVNIDIEAHRLAASNIHTHTHKAVTVSDFWVDDSHSEKFIILILSFWYHGKRVVEFCHSTLKN